MILQCNVPQLNAQSSHFGKQVASFHKLPLTISDLLQRRTELIEINYLFQKPEESARKAMGREANIIIRAMLLEEVTS